ncbi:MAG: hypothetical protein ACI841_005254 [Planctomycetota bacterium]|jgi:hypothetical protein
MSDVEQAAALIEELEAAVMAFRLGMDGEAGAHFARFIDALGPSLTNTGAGPRAEDLLPYFPEILAAQRRGDGLAVADSLEFQIRPRIESPSH